MSERVNIVAEIDAAICALEGPVRERRGHKERLYRVRGITSELIEAGSRLDAAIMAWRMSGKPDYGELNAAHGDLVAVLARIGGS